MQTFLRIFLLFSLVFFSILPLRASSLDVFIPTTYLDYGYVDYSRSYCVRIDAKVNCDYRSEAIPALPGLKEIFINFDITCAIQDESITCWKNDNRQIIFQENSLKNPRILNPTALNWFEKHATGGFYVMHDQGLTYFQIKESPFHHVGREEILFPQLKKIKMYSVYSKSVQLKDHLVCAIDDQDDLGCIYEDRFVSPKYHFHNPKYLSVTNHHICIIDDQGLNCWRTLQDTPVGRGSYSDNYPWFEREAPQIWMPPFKNPKMIGDLYTTVSYQEGRNSYDNFICVLDDAGVICWQDFAPTYGYTPPTPKVFRVKGLNKPQKFISPQCVLDSEGTKCWEGDGIATIEKYKLEFAVDFNYFEQYFNLLAESSTTARAYYFRTMLDVIRQNSIETDALRYFTLALAAPAILSADSNYFTQSIIPKFPQGLEKINSTLHYQSLSEALAQTEDAAATRVIALQSLRATLQAAIDFVQTPSGRKSVQQSLVLIGQALADPSDAKIKLVTAQIEALTEVKTQLQLPKSAFLINLIDTAADWLGKVSAK